MVGIMHSFLARIKTVVFAFLLLYPLISNAQSRLGSWEIEEGNLIQKEQLDNQFAETYWEKINSILPNETLQKYIVRLSLFTDGEQEDLGGITPLSENNNEWEIDLDTFDMSFHAGDSAYVLDYTHTLIHEFGHLLTLNSSQLITTEDKFQNDALGYLTSEGYAPLTSYLGKFVDQFWSMELLRRWDAIDKIKWEKRKLDLLFEFYLSMPENFVTDYAAESPEEDIAESWAYFVFCPQTKGELIKHKKVNFFYQFPELVEIRDSIRKKLTFIPKNYLESFAVEYEEE